LARRNEQGLTPQQISGRYEHTRSSYFISLFNPRFLHEYQTILGGTNLTYNEALEANVDSNNLAETLKNKFVNWMQQTALTKEEPDATRHPSPLNLILLKAKTVVVWLIALKKSNGLRWSKAYYANRVSGLGDYFCDSGIERTNTFNSQISQALSGINRQIQDKAKTHGLSLEQGMKPMSFELYQDLCKWWAMDSGNDAIFARCFITLTWNLMCRSNNTVNIRREHIEMKGDCIAIKFAHTKSDQEGMESAYDRHVFANPKNWIICPHNALACYLMTVGHGGNRINEGELFGGNSQYNRFSNILETTLKEHEFEIKVDIKLIGVHSIRKGAATYCCNGTTDGPNLASICNQAGWTMGKVKDTYIKYEVAGDQRVGCTVAGLDVTSIEFGITCPLYLATPNAQGAYDST
jgi:hypothetical protein